MLWSVKQSHPHAHLKGLWALVFVDFMMTLKVHILQFQLSVYLVSVTHRYKKGPYSKHHELRLVLCGISWEITVV